MKKFIYILILISLKISGQSSSKPVFEIIDLGTEDENQGSIENYFQNSDGNLVFIKQHEKKLFAEVRDSSMHLILEQNITDLPQDDSYTLEQYILNQDQLVVIYSVFENDISLFSLYYYQIDLNKLSQTQPEKFYQLETKKYPKDIIVNFHYSIDHSHQLIAVHPPSKGNNLESINFYLFDYAMQPLWKNEEFEIDSRDREYGVMDILVGNNGKIYLTGIRVFDLDKRKYELYSILGSTVNKIEYTFKDLEIKKAEAFLDQNNQLVLASYFYNNYENKKDKGLKGIAYTKFDGENLSVASETKQTFSVDLLTAGMHPYLRKKIIKKVEKKGFDPGAKFLDINKIFMDLSTGELYFIGQQSYMKIEQNSNYTTKKVYYFDNIYISKFSSNNELIYNAKIPFEYVTSLNLTWNHYDIIFKNGQLSFVFLDHRDNVDADHLREKGVQTSSRKTNGILSYATLSDDGSVERDILYDYVEDGILTFAVIDCWHDPKHFNSIMISYYENSKTKRIGLIK